MAAVRRLLQHSPALRRAMLTSPTYATGSSKLTMSNIAFFFLTQLRVNFFGIKYVAEIGYYRRN